MTSCTEEREPMFWTAVTAREVPESTGHLVFARCHGVRAPVETGEVQHLPALAEQTGDEP